MFTQFTFSELHAYGIRRKRHKILENLKFNLVFNKSFVHKEETCSLYYWLHITQEYL